MPKEPWDEVQMSDRHAVASGLDEGRMRDTHADETGSETAFEEQLDKLSKTVRFEQEAPSAASSSDPLVAPECPASGERQSRPGSLLVQKSGHADDDSQVSALDIFYELDGRKSCFIREVLGLVSRRRSRISQEK